MSKLKTRLAKKPEGSALAMAQDTSDASQEKQRMYKYRPKATWTIEYLGVTFPSPYWTLSDAIEVLARMHGNTRLYRIVAPNGARLSLDAAVQML